MLLALLLSMMTNTKHPVDSLATLVARYEYCRARVKRAEDLNQSDATINRWYREMFRAEDRMKAAGI